MDSLAAYGISQAARARNSPTRVFDWIKAAKILSLRRVQNASAGLESDLEYTEGEILENGKPIVETSAYLASIWATPLLIIDGEEIECWIYEKDATWDCSDANKVWPEAALKIMEENKE